MIWCVQVRVSVSDAMTLTTKIQSPGKCLTAMKSRKEARALEEINRNEIQTKSLLFFDPRFYPRFFCCSAATLVGLYC